MKNQSLVYLVNRVRAKIRVGALHCGAILFWCSKVTIVGDKLRTIRTHKDDNGISIRIKDSDAPRSGTERLDYATGRVFCTETIVQVPISCSLSVFCWPMAAPGSKASPSAMNPESLKLCHIGSLPVTRACCRRTKRSFA